MRTAKTFKIDHVSGFKQQLLHWAQQFEEVVWLDSNNYPERYSDYDAVMAVSALTAIQTDFEQAFEKLQEYQTSTADWIFGYLSYDLKNDTEALFSNNHDQLHFPDLYFFQPKKLFLLKENEVELQYLRLVEDEMDSDFNEIIEDKKKTRAYREEKIENREESKENRKESIEERREYIEKRKGSDAKREGKKEIKPRIPKAEYLKKVGKMLDSIQRGDIYEANFCQEFYVEAAEIDPLWTFERLNGISNPPFACFLKLNEHYALSASPERYIKKKGRNIISQPIKGTIGKSSNNAKDEIQIDCLKNDPKERSENIMIVDLVRNDLSRTAKKASVEVEELCGIYSFGKVHQMISTVKSVLEDGIPAVELLRTTFPMGSMTGAPKISAMKIIEELEESKRGLYSGSIGYFTPAGDFDFNVVIRSILYNKANRYASFSVGGAITAKSVPEKEYMECLLKGKAMREVLQAQLL